MPDSHPDVDDLPPSSRYVLDVVDDEEQITRQALLHRTGLPERTLDRALDRLENRGSVRVTRKNEDLRQVVAILATERDHMRDAD